MNCKESETVEFKKTTAELKEAVISIVAMLNKHGQAKVYFGIADDGRIIGQMVGRKTIKDITQAIVDNTEPKVFPKVEHRKIDGKECLGEVLFCDDNPMEVQAAIFATTDKLTFLDIKQFKGNLFGLRQQAEIYVNEHMKWRADLSESRRREIPEIPVRAFSEAIGNSLCHRDFENPKGNEVAIFKDRIEIYNPGLFPEELDPEDFFSGHEHSILRNPLIAETMYRSKDIERWGSGIKRIHDECVAAGVQVDFKRLKTGFVVVFHRPKWEEGEGLGKGGQKRWSEKVVRN